jgi:hypothetical protein
MHLFEALCKNTLIRIRVQRGRNRTSRRNIATR